jgi:hypothetical protein
VRTTGFFKIALQQACCIVLLALASQAHAVSVQYACQDLADACAGDLRLVDDTISGALDPFEPINILFDPAKFAALCEASHSATVLIFMVASPPVPMVFAYGQLTNTAIGALPASLISDAGLHLIWLSTGKPGRQAPDHSSEGFAMASSGSTTAVNGAPEIKVGWQNLDGPLMPALAILDCRQAGAF